MPTDVLAAQAAASFAAALAGTLVAGVARRVLRRSPARRRGRQVAAGGVPEIGEPPAAPAPVGSSARLAAMTAMTVPVLPAESARRRLDVEIWLCRAAFDLEDDAPEALSSAQVARLVIAAKNYRDAIPGPDRERLRALHRDLCGPRDEPPPLEVRFP
jgi:hypothetical protein